MINSLGWFGLGALVPTTILGLLCIGLRNIYNTQLSYYAENNKQQAKLSYALYRFYYRCGDIIKHRDSWQKTNARGFVDTLKIYHDQVSDHVDGDVESQMADLEMLQEIGDELVIQDLYQEAAKS